jgi:hypothetical protein
MDGWLPGGRAHCLILRSAQPVSHVLFVFLFDYDRCGSCQHGAFLQLTGRKSGRCVVFVLLPYLQCDIYTTNPNGSIMRTLLQQLAAQKAKGHI